MYLPTPYKISYDTQRYPFRQIVSQMLEISEGDIIQLEDLHLLEKYDTFIKGTEQSTKWHKMYYDKFEKEFYPLYFEFIKELKQRFEYDEIIYQKIPTFRIQLVNGNLGVFEWHKDRSYNHGTSEVNFWMPFVNTNEYNTIWLESKENKSALEFIIRIQKAQKKRGINYWINTAEDLESYNSYLQDLLELNDLSFLSLKEYVLTRDTEFINTDEQTNILTENNKMLQV